MTVIEVILCILAILDFIVIVGYTCFEYINYHRLWGTSEPWNEERYQQLKEKWDKELEERQKIEKEG